MSSDAGVPGTPLLPVASTRPPPPGGGKAAATQRARRGTRLTRVRARRDGPSDGGSLQMWMWAVEPLVETSVFLYKAAGVPCSSCLLERVQQSFSTASF